MKKSMIALALVGAVSLPLGAFAVGDANACTGDGSGGCTSEHTNSITVALTKSAAENGAQLQFDTVDNPSAGYTCSFKDDSGAYASYSVDGQDLVYGEAFHPKSEISSVLYFTIKGGKDFDADSSQRTVNGVSGMYGANLTIDCEPSSK